MNKNIEIIRESLQNIENAQNELEKEAPEIRFLVSVSYYNHREPKEVAEELEAYLNKARLKNAALAKLTQQDKEVLGLRNE
jgi:hypothetical protein